MLRTCVSFKKAHHLADEPYQLFARTPLTDISLFLRLLTLFLEFLTPPPAHKCSSLCREVQKQQFLNLFADSWGGVVLLLWYHYEYVSLPDENNMT